MANITVDTYLDSAARTAGESFTISNDATLTIRTDTRVHANAPIDRTGSLSSIFLSNSSGGHLVFDARNIRCIAYTGGSGLCPAIGTLITQGDVSGYLLGVYGSWDIAPVVPGVTIPTSGFMKFREVTGGSFSAGTLSGITATAAGADFTGWMEVVMDLSSVITMARMNSHFSYGDWFYLDNTTGVIGQTLQVPTNGGGNNTLCPGVWVETAPASDTYEFYPAVITAQFNTTNIGTDARNKFVEMRINGMLRFGTNGSANIGFVPPAGCKTRIPNIFLRQCGTSTRADNNSPNVTLTTRPRWDTSQSGHVELGFLYGDWYFNFVQPYKTKITNSAYMDTLTVSEQATTGVFNTLGNGNPYNTIPVTALSITASKSGMTITDVKACRVHSASAGHAVMISGCSNITVNGLRGIIRYAARLSGVYAINFNLCSRLTVEDIQCFNGTLGLTTVSAATFRDLDHVDVLVGETKTSPAIAAITMLSGCSDIVIDGVTCGLNNTIGNCYPYTGVLSSTSCNHVKLRNVGTLANPLRVGATVLGVGKLIVSGGQNDNFKIQRCHITGVSGDFLTTDNSDKDFVFENCGEGTISMNAHSAIMKGVSLSWDTSAIAVFDTVFADSFSSDSLTGKVGVICNEPSDIYFGYFSRLLGTVRFSGMGSLLFVGGSAVEWETPYFVIGHTSFANASIVLNGVSSTANFVVTYKIDTGNGFGEYKSAIGSNLSTEAISPETGFKLRIRVACISNDSLSSLYFITNSTLEAREANQYALDSVALELTGLKEGSEVRCYVGDTPETAIEVGGVENSTTSFTLYHAVGGQSGYIIIHALAYESIYLPLVYSSSNQGIIIQQQIDRNYKND